jgi:hypothetical protein
MCHASLTLQDKQVAAKGSIDERSPCQCPHLTHNEQHNRVVAHARHAQQLQLLLSLSAPSLVATGASILHALHSRFSDLLIGCHFIGQV